MSEGEKWVGWSDEDGEDTVITRGAAPAAYNNAVAVYLEHGPEIEVIVGSMADELNRIMDGRPPNDVVALEEWLSTVPEDEIEKIMDGPRGPL